MDQQIEYLCMLPVDVLRSIIHELDYESASNLVKICESNIRYELVKLECDRRMSVLQYLEETFTHTHELLRSMARADAYIWGGKAAAFFIRNSATNNSSWNISVPTYGPNLVTLMRTLERCGVVWNTVLDDVREIFAKGHGFITVDTTKYRAYSTSIIDVAINEFHYEFILEPRTSNSGAVEIHVENKWVRVKNTKFNNDSFLRHSVWTCTGYINHAHSRTKVRIGGEPKYEMNALARCHSSCMQAIISPHVAIHLFGKLACSSKSRAWTTNTAIIVGGHCLEYKELERGGFVYERPAITEGWQSPNSESATVVRYSNSTGFSPNVVNADIEYYCSMSWQILDSHIQFEPPRAMRYHRLRCVLTISDKEANEQGDKYLRKYVPRSSSLF